MMKCILKSGSKKMLGVVLGSFLLCNAPCGAMETVWDAAVAAFLVKDNKGWDEYGFNDLLKQQNFTEMMPRLYHFVDKNANIDAGKWIEKQALLGHVPMLYMDVRRLARMPDDKMSVPQRSEFFKKMCIALLRTAQDIVTCEFDLGHELVHDVNIIKDATVQDAYETLKSKFRGTFFTGHDARRWPNYKDVFDEVFKWFEVDRCIESLPSPAWCCSFGWQRYRYNSLFFATPTYSLRKSSGRPGGRALIDLTRKAVYAKAKKVLAEVNNWEEFFELPVTAFFVDAVDDDGN